jgi:PhnB protein
MSKINPIPAGYHNVIPYLSMKNADKAIEFYKNVFNAKEIGRITMPGGIIGHAELQVGDSRIMIAEEMPDWGNKGPETLGGSCVVICLYVEDVDKVYKKAIENGARVDNNMEPRDQFYGDRTGSLVDPFGHKWSIATHIEDVSFEEMQRRSDNMFAQPQG